MAKILLLILVVWIVYIVIKRYKHSLSATRAVIKPAEDMVKCAQCEVNLPRGEALYTQGEFFCTAEHQRLGKK